MPKDIYEEFEDDEEEPPEPPTPPTPPPTPPSTGSSVLDRLINEPISPTEKPVKPVDPLKLFSDAFEVWWDRWQFGKPQELADVVKKWFTRNKRVLFEKSQQEAAGVNIPLGTGIFTPSVGKPPVIPGPAYFETITQPIMEQVRQQAAERDRLREQASQDALQRYYNEKAGVLAVAQAKEREQGRLSDVQQLLAGRPDLAEFVRPNEFLSVSKILREERERQRLEGQAPAGALAAFFPQVKPEFQFKTETPVGGGPAETVSEETPMVSLAMLRGQQPRPTTISELAALAPSQQAQLAGLIGPTAWQDLVQKARQQPRREGPPAFRSIIPRQRA